MVILDSQKTNMAIPCLSQIEVGKAESQVCEIGKNRGKLQGLHKISLVCLLVLNYFIGFSLICRIPIKQNDNKSF